MRSEKETKYFWCLNLQIIQKELKLCYGNFKTKYGLPFWGGGTLYPLSSHKEENLITLMLLPTIITSRTFLKISFIHMYIQCLDHFSPLPHCSLPFPHPLPLPPIPLLPGRNYFALISNFVEERV
jgi:hypothetical protein